MDVGAAFDEAGVDHQLAVQRDIGRDALDHHFRQRDLHAADRLFARGAVSDDLADHRIVVRRYIVTGIGVRINADAGAARRVPGGDAARRRRELERVLGVDAALDGVAGQHHVALAEAQLLAVGDADLFLHDVDAGDHFGDRVFDLHAGVHLDELELAVFIQELEGAGAAVADLAASFGAAVADFFDQLARDAGRWRLFDDLLVAALHRAVALAQPDGVFVFVGQDLDFHVTRIFQILLHIDFRIAEGGARFGLGHRHGVDQCCFGIHHAHAAATAAASRLDDDRVADLARNLHDRLWIIRQRAVRTWHARYAGLDHGLLGGDLVAHQADRFRAGADEDEAGFFHAFGEVGVFRQEAIPRVDCFGFRHFGGARRSEERRVGK